MFIWLETGIAITAPDKPKIYYKTKAIAKMANFGFVFYIYFKDDNLFVFQKDIIYLAP